jgi:hypothetical protein
MLYKTDRRHGLHHGGEQLAFPALARRMKMRLCLGKRLEQMDEDVHRVFFRDTELGEFNSSDMRFRPALRA